MTRFLAPHKLSALALVLGFAFSAFAQGNPAGYTLLEPEVVGMSEGSQITANFLGYINLFYQVLLWLTIALAIIYIVIGGLQYVLSAAAIGKADGKDKIYKALLGLFIALISYLILYSINPDLVNWRLCIPNLPSLSCN